MTIGYVGLGNIRGALARWSQLEHQIYVHDLNTVVVKSMEENGATGAASLGDLASRCNMIFLCLPTSAQVRGGIFGENGLAVGLTPGTLLVDQTTGDPSATRDMSTELASRGVDLIDAPVSGGATGADAGTIAIMVGAGPELYAKSHPILAAIAPTFSMPAAWGTGMSSSSSITCSRALNGYSPLSRWPSR